MHVNWQRKLISKLLEINPNCQLLIATHSGSLLGRGWMENFKRVEEVLFPYKSKPSLSEMKSNENIAETEEAKLSRIQLALDNLEGSPYQKLMDFTPIINKEHTLSHSEAMKMIAMLKKKNIQPNMITYNPLLKKMNWEEGKLFFSDMKATFKKTNEKYLVDFVYALNLLLKKAPNLYNALSLIEEMEKENIKPDIISFSTLIGKTLTNEDIRAVEKLRIYYGIEKNATYLMKLQFKNYFE
jgi:Pentatricopeptide repeat domain